MKSSILLLSKVLVCLMLLAPQAHAAVAFISGSEQVAPNEIFSLPVTASGFTDVTTFQFVLSWDKDVISFSSVNLSTTDLPNLALINFYTTEAANGKLRLSWDFTPTTLDGVSTMFAINYTAVGAAGNQSLVSFGGETGFPLEVSVNYVEVFDSVFSPGTVNVVPEPVNLALGVFAGLFAGGTTLRWVFRKRSVRSAE